MQLPEAEILGGGGGGDPPGHAKNFLAKAFGVIRTETLYEYRAVQCKIFIETLTNYPVTFNESNTLLDQPTDLKGRI